MVNPALKKALEALGALAEMNLVFYRAVINAGGTRREAIDLTEAYMEAVVAQSMKPQEKQEDE